MARKPHGFLLGILSIAETAFCTFLIIIMLIVVFAVLLGYTLYLLPKYPQIPFSWLWPIVWGGMGLVVVFLLALYLWWGWMMKDREELKRLAK